MNEVYDISTLEESVAYAQEVVPIQLKALAQQGGASQIEVQMSRVDRNVRSIGWEQQVYL